MCERVSVEGLTCYVIPYYDLLCQVSRCIDDGCAWCVCHWWQMRMGGTNVGQEFEVIASAERYVNRVDENSR